jgi:hypothetical protein
LEGTKTFLLASNGQYMSMVVDNLELVYQFSSSEAICMVG